MAAAAPQPSWPVVPSDRSVSSRQGRRDSARACRSSSSRHPSARDASERCERRSRPQLIRRICRAVALRRRVDSICLLCLGAGCGQAEPQTHGSFDGCQLSTAQFTQRTNQLCVRNRDEVLRVEHARSRNATDIAASNWDWRGLVVCGTSVTRARSVSSAGMLMTSAGRTSRPCRGPPTRPRPGAAMSFRLLATIEFGKQAISGRHQVIVLRHVVRSQGHSTCELRDELRPIPIRERLKFVEQFLRCFRHEIRVPCWALRVKLVGEFRGLTSRAE